MRLHLAASTVTMVSLVPSIGSVLYPHKKAHSLECALMSALIFLT